MKKFFFILFFHFDLIIKFLKKFYFFNQKKNYDGYVIIKKIFFKNIYYKKNIMKKIYFIYYCNFLGGLNKKLTINLSKSCFFSDFDSAIRNIWIFCILLLKLVYKKIIINF